MNAFTSKSEDYYHGSSLDRHATTAIRIVALDLLQRLVVCENVQQATHAHFYGFQKVIIDEFSKKKAQTDT